MNKPHITRTLAQIHFEDLDPHRFEDLLRELIYDFRDWQSIESTGRGGSDDGFDVRAFEKVRATENTPSVENEEQEDEVTAPHPMEGNTWMIQAKREKAIGPARVKEIVSEIDSTNPPYGYILAAASNFSKESHDVFREELRAKGVMEFFLWGSGALEDMLLLPKNDRILFAFFGISLSTSRRTRVTSVRSSLNAKNKLLKLFGGDFDGSLHLLVRDIDDSEYPYEDKYQDFADNPRWKVYEAFHLHPLGLLVHVRKNFAYLDLRAKTWDRDKSASLLEPHPDSHDHDEAQKRSEARWKAEEYFGRLPLANQATFHSDGIIRFEDIRIIDEKGDATFGMPHVYSLFSNKKGPFSRSRRYFTVDETEIAFDDSLKRIEIFPATYEAPPHAKHRSEKAVEFSEFALTAFNTYQQSFNILWDPDGRYAHLEPADYVDVTGAREALYLQVTNKIKTTVGAYLASRANPNAVIRAMELQLGKRLDDAQEVHVIEFRRHWKFKD